jgi:tetratricopeptide (TPR) repeat protein
VILRGSGSSKAQSELEQAIDGLRRAGQIDELPKALLTRAWLRSALGDLDAARTDLDEAQEIAERGPMPLYLADINLYRARLFHDRDALAEARRLVEKHGYGRRREELEDLEAMAAEW